MILLGIKKMRDSERFPSISFWFSSSFYNQDANLTHGAGRLNSRIFACVCKEVTDTADPLSECSEFVERHFCSSAVIRGDQNEQALMLCFLSLALTYFIYVFIF